MKAIKAILVVLLVVVTGITHCQTQSWSWANRVGSTGSDNGRGLATDSQGNQYVVGNFRGSVTFGSTTLTSSGLSDIYIAKFNPAGNWVWAKKAGRTGDDMGRDVAVDNSGNVYIIGHFPGTATFGTTTLTSSGSYDVFIAKLDGNGNWLWAKKAGGSGADNGHRIAMDSSNNVYITGLFSGTASFGSSNIGSSGGFDAYIAKLNSAGTWQWAKKAGGTGSDYGFGLKPDVDGNVYLSGFFEGSATFGSTTLNSYGDKDIFIAKLTSSGSWLWTRKAGGTGADASTMVTLDNEGFVYATGYFSTTGYFGGISLVSGGSSDAFVAKMDTDGNWIWASRAGGALSDDVSHITVDYDNNLYVTGTFRGVAGFGDTTLTSSGDDDVFIARLDSGGNWLNALKAGGSEAEDSSGIGVDAIGNVYIAGFFTGSANFGPATLNSAGGTDIFVAKISPPQYELEITSTPSNAMIYKDGISTGFITPHIFNNSSAELLGTYSLVLEDYYYEPQTLTGIEAGTILQFTGYYVGSDQIDWLWASRAGGAGEDQGYAIATDSSNNTYVAGSFEGTATFGSTTLVSAGMWDVFVAKMDTAGNWLWARRAGGSSYARVKGLAVDTYGNCYLSGYIYATATFGSTTLTSSGSSDTFVAKLDTSGSWLWAVRGGGSSHDFANGISIDSEGNLYIVGSFKQTVTFGSSTFTSSGDYDAFIAKLGPSGNWLWATKAGGIGTDTGEGIGTDSAGNSVITGLFKETATFGTTTLTSNGEGDIYVARLGTYGNWLWAVSAGGSDEDYGQGISTDSSGSSVVTGYFIGTAAFDTSPLTSKGDRDIFVAKLDTSGNWLWAVSSGGNSSDRGYGISTDYAGDTYVTGYFTNQATFGNRILNGMGGADVFVTKLDSTGNWLWAEGAGGSGSDNGLAITIAQSGAVCLTGYFESTASFGNTNLSSQGGNDVFVAMLPTTSSLQVISSPPGARIIKDGIDTGFVTPHMFSDAETGLVGSYSAELDCYLFETVTVTAIIEDTDIFIEGTYVEPPAVLATIEAITMNMNQVHEIASLDLYFSSIDPGIVYSVLGNIQVNWQSIAPHTITLLPENDWYGTEYLTIRATDSWGRFAEQAVRVTVWETWTLVEDFDHEGNLPIGWNVFAGGSSVFPWQPVASAGNGYMMKTMSTLGSTANEKLVSSTFNLSAYEAIEVSFNTSFLNFGNGIGTFAYSLDNVTYTTIETLSQPTDGTKTYSLAGLTGRPNVRFRWTFYNPLANTGQNNHWTLDDFTIYARLRDMTPPSQVTGLTVQQLTPSSATLVWNPSSDIYFNRYKIYVSTDSEVNLADMLWSVSDDPMLNDAATHQTVIAPLAMGTYWAAIRAEDLSGNNSVFSETVTFILEDSSPVLSNPYPAVQPSPEWSQSLEVSYGCTISDISPLDMQTLAYRIDLNQNGIYDEDESWTPISLRGMSNRNSRDSLNFILDTILNSDGIYSWEIKAGDLIGNMAYSGMLGLEGIADDWIIRADATPPTPIDDFFVQGVDSNSITLNWTASSDQYFRGYKVYYSTLQEVCQEDSLWDGESDPNLYYPGSGLVSTAVTGLAPATRYYFLIQATDEAGWITPHPAVITAMTSSEHQPMQPQAVIVSIQNDILTVDWEDVTHDIMGNPVTISFYEVHVSNQPYFICTPDTQLQTVLVSQLAIDGLTEYADRLFFKVIAVSGAFRGSSENISSPRLNSNIKELLRRTKE